MFYSVTQAAKELGITTATVRSWGAKVANHLSKAANPDEGQERKYSDDDMAVLITVKVLRDQGMKFADIRGRLADGERLEPIPESPLAEGIQSERGNQVASRALVPADLLDKFVALYEDSQAARIEAESRAAAAESEADMLRSELARSRRGFWSRLLGR